MRQACSASSPRGFANSRRTLGGRGAHRAHRHTEARGAREALGLLQASAEASEQEPVTQRQGIFLSNRDAVFFFAWLPLFEGPLHLAREAYFLDYGGDE